MREICDVCPAAQRLRCAAAYDATATVLVFVRMLDTALERGIGLGELLDGCVLPGSRPVPAQESQMDLFTGEEDG